MSRRLILSAMPLLLGGTAWSFGYHDAIADGSVIDGTGISSASFGGVAAVGVADATCLLLNPSALVADGGTRLLLAAGPGLGRETVLDEFGRHNRDYITIGAVNAGFSTALSASLAAGAVMARISDASFDAVQYVSTDSSGQGDIDYVDEFESSGGAWEAAAGAGWKAADWLRVGASAGYRFGEAEWTFSRDWVDESEDDSLADGGWEEGSPALHAGVTADLGGAEAGFSWSSTTDHVPGRMALGARLISEGDFNGSFGAEGRITDYDDESLLGGSLFASYRPSGGFELRGALFFEESQLQDMESMLGTALGFSAVLGRVTLQGCLSSSGQTRTDEAFGFFFLNEARDIATLIILGMDWRL
jgi:hypothetical protein